MTARERVEAALRWQPVDFVPFTVYESKLPMGAVERRLRNDGLCIHERRPNVYVTHLEGISTESHPTVYDGRSCVRTIYHTPRGDLTTVTEPAGFTTWTHEHLFKGPDDYEPLLALIEAERYEPNYEAFLARRAWWEDDAFVRATIGYTPLNHIIYRIMGPLTFALEWADHRADVMRLYDALCAKRRELYPIVAESPAVAVNVCGNLSPQIIGRERFEELVLPHFEETCWWLRPQGILVGSHLDDNCRLWADLIGRSSLDYIEAFTPAPDTDMTLAEARAAWPDKVLWVNFPSSVHLEPAEVIAETTRRLIAEAGDGRGFLLAITEDVPEDRWPESFATILRVCREAGPR